MIKGKEYELLAERIFKDIQPDAKIIHNDKIVGAQTKKKRQIDVSIRHSVAGSDILMIVQAKDRGRKADITHLGEFYAVIDDVNAQKGIFISRAGFTADAIEHAKSKNIDIYTAYDSVNFKGNYKRKVRAYQFIETFECKKSVMITALDFGDFKINREQNQFETYKQGDKEYTFGLLLAHHLKNKFEKSDVNLKVVIPGNDTLYTNMINNEWKKVHQIEFTYRHLKTEVFRSIVDIDFVRTLEDHKNKIVKDTYWEVKEESLLPIVQNNKWEKIDDYNKEEDRKLDHLIITTNLFNRSYIVAGDFVRGSSTHT